MESRTYFKRADFELKQFVVPHRPKFWKNFKGVRENRLMVFPRNVYSCHLLTLHPQPGLAKLFVLMEDSQKTFQKTMKLLGKTFK